MNFKDKLLCWTLKCWVLDVIYLAELCENQGIELDLDEIESMYWNIEINNLIYERIKTIVFKFISDYQIVLENLLEIENIYDYESNNTMYSIQTNYIDSWVWFEDNRIQNLFESSKYYI